MLPSLSNANLRITRAMKELKESGKVIQEGKRIILPPSKLN
jgi:hypothetical protein